MRERPTPFNPLTKPNLAASIVAEVLRQEVSPLPPPSFVGAGLYLIYYLGGFEAYQPIARANHDNQFRLPIYVGKAVPAGTRKGNAGFEVDHGDALARRLREHARSIEVARNLSVADFRCRWLVVDEVFISLGETLLISHFKPLWNVVVDGFGNHKPGKGREAGMKSMWDAIHPGRAWAEGLRSPMGAPQVLELVREHLPGSSASG